MAHYKGAATEATRAMNIMKKRERAREELELKKRKIEEDLKLSTIDNKFATHHDAIESQLRSSTVGLVTLDQMRQKQENAVKEREKQLVHNQEESSKKLQKQLLSTDTPSRKYKTLSFGYDDDDDDDDDEGDEDEEGDDNGGGGNDEKGEKDVDEKQNKSSISDATCSDRLIGDTQKKPGVENCSDFTSDQKLSHKNSLIKDKKNVKLPAANFIDVDTSFLPDREREEEERLLREKLAEEWREQQRKLKEEEIEITFSYWDGSGHRRVVQMKKGNSIYQFLQACLDNLRKDFNELRSVSADQLMYVKEDLIIPHHYTFYDFIITKARGKSGPLFSFDVHDDVRLIADATVEKDESHAGKVLLRSWYERNKHIFPASRWEPYDPTKTYEKYTISDKRSK